MVSSTFTDLKEHREAAIKAIHEHKLHSNVMEHDNAKPATDVIESSLRMVRDSAAYILVIGFKYGQTPIDANRNKDQLSITELEFNEAQELDRPILLFIMGDEHPVKKDDIEKDPEKEKRLNAFRERAKKKVHGGLVNRVYATFNSLEEFKQKLGSSLNELCQLLETAKHTEPHKERTFIVESFTFKDSSIPIPPAFYAKPDYIGRHTFVGRTAQLQVLTEWAKPTDSTSILLFEAIGGNGKSMLTWEWTTKHAEAARAGPEPWAGRFWYSFYEKGAIMRDFCLHALHYMTQQPMETLEKKPMAELRTALLAQLHARPWLLILDGLERVLVAYHRIDAAEVRDEEVNRPTDKILDRDPCDAIRDEDTELLRALAAAKPSKILISSRLIPRVLLNPSGLPLPGVRPLVLPGLDDADAERLFCEVCGIRGTSADICYYLKTFCDNHPLVIGVLAGLINSPGPHRGHFDAWAAAPEYGAKLNLARLDLIQSRNHILRAAMEALEAPSRQLLSTLALLTDAVDYDTVAAFNPHLPPEPKEVDDPTDPHNLWMHWADGGPISSAQSATGEGVKEPKKFEAAIAMRDAYEQAMQAWRASSEFREAPKKLAETVKDLEHRGLLQYDSRTQRYDLHPVVRGIATGGMKDEERRHLGMKVIDYFSSTMLSDEEIDSVDELRPAFTVVRVLQKLGDLSQAAWLYGTINNTLVRGLEAHSEVLALLRPFFSNGWVSLPSGIPLNDACNLANDVAVALTALEEFSTALRLNILVLQQRLASEKWHHANSQLLNTAWTLTQDNRLARAHHLHLLSFDFAVQRKDPDYIFISRLFNFSILSRMGMTNHADREWELLRSSNHELTIREHRHEAAAWRRSEALFWGGTLTEDDILHAEDLAERIGNRFTIRNLQRLRGFWTLEKGSWKQAETSFAEAIHMARKSGMIDGASETGLALAKHHLGQLTGDAARSEAERLAGLRQPAHRTLAQLWLAIGDTEKAKHHALAAYTWAWADGEPYVNRYELTKTTELLQQMNVPVPVLPPYDPAKDEPFPWEADVRAAIEKLRAEKK